MARNMLLAKIAPSFRTILGNSEGPLMELFSQFTRGTETPRSLTQKKAVEAVRDGTIPASAIPIGAQVSQSRPAPSEGKAVAAKESKP